MDNNLEAIKEIILKKLVERDAGFRIDFERIDESAKRIGSAVKSILKENKISLRHHEEENLLNDIISSLLGLGPLEKFLKDNEITEIMVNGPKEIYIERNGNIELTDVVFRDNDQLSYFIERILSPLGRRVSELDPFIDGRLADGSRVNIVRSPVSTIGSILTIRKFSYRVFTAEDLIRFGTINVMAAEFLKACVETRLNILICGGAGSGKTTLMNVLCSFIPAKERVITIEETRELRLNRAHTVPLETRLPNIEGKGEITSRQLIRNALHMRPDRIIVGEVRSGEILDMIQAMSTGHEGSMTTIHANNSLEAMDRLEILALMGSLNLSSEVAKRQIINAVDLIINMSRMPDGLRKVTQIVEVVKSKEYKIEDIMILSRDSKEPGLRFTGHKPHFYQRLKDKVNYFCGEFENGA